MTQVNLLPVAVRNRQRVRRVTMAAIGAVLAVMVVLSAVFVLQSARLGQEDRQLAAVQALNTGLRGKIARLQTYDQLKRSVVARQAIVDGLLNEQVLWSQVLENVSTGMSDGIGLTSLTASLNAPGGTTGSTTPIDSSLVGQITLQGNALDFHRLSAWLTRLEQVDGWANPWVSTATRGDLNGTSIVQFAGSIDLTTGATVNGRPR
jgi:Tfp pilus assembly protein PilN